MERVIDSMKTNRVQVVNIPLSLIDSNFSRPYYRLSAKDSDRTQGSEKYYYDVLFDTIEAEGLDSNVSIKPTMLGLKVDERAQCAIGNRPVANLWAAGETMAGSILGQGYLAGFGMTIGTVFGRIAGQEAAAHVA